MSWRLRAGVGATDDFFRSPDWSATAQADFAARRLIVDLIDQENWSASGADLKGDADEALLSKGASDNGSSASQ